MKKIVLYCNITVLQLIHVSFSQADDRTKILGAKRATLCIPKSGVQFCDRTYGVILENPGVHGRVRWESFISNHYPSSYLDLELASYRFKREDTVS